MAKYKGWSGLYVGTLVLFNGEFSVMKPLEEEDAVVVEIGKRFDAMDKVALKYGVNNPAKLKLGQ